MERKMDHIGLICNDLEANVKWYMEKMGFTVKGRFINNGKVFYFMENPADGLVYEMFEDQELPADIRGKIDHIAYYSDDLDADYEYCVENGYVISSNGIEEIPAFWENGCRFFTVQTPCGEKVEYCHS